MGENGQLNPDLPIRVRCGRDWDADGIRIGFLQKPDPETRGRLVMVPNWVYYTPSDGPKPQSFIRLSSEDAQTLMDRLYDCGLRPTQSHGSPGQVQAMEANLSDLRWIVKLMISFVTKEHCHP